MNRSEYVFALKRLASLTPLFLLFLGPLSLLYLLFLSNVQLKKLDATEAKINMLHRNFVLAKLQKEKEHTFLSKLKTASPYYINEHLESLEFLKNERERAPHSENHLSRMPIQHLRFFEGKIRRTKELQEMEENQESAVLMNEDDLKKTLTLIEGVGIPPYESAPNAPELFIKSIDLRKTTLSTYENAFEVSMQLIKREGIR